MVVLLSQTYILNIMEIDVQLYVRTQNNVC